MTFLHLLIFFILILGQIIRVEIDDEKPKIVKYFCRIIIFFQLLIFLKFNIDQIFT